MNDTSPPKTADGSRAMRARRYVPAAATMLLGFAISAAVFTKVREYRTEGLRSDVAQRTDALIGYFELDFVSEFAQQTIENALPISRALAFAGDPTPGFFADLSKAQVKRSSAVVHVTVVWYPRVEAEDRAAFESAAAATLGIPFEIVEPEPDGASFRAADRAEYFPAFYIETEFEEDYSHGIDVGADPIARKALDWARDTGLTTVFTEIPMDIESSAGIRFVQCQPIYRGASSNRTVPERRRDLIGYLGNVTVIPPDFATQLFQTAGGVAGYLTQNRSIAAAQFLGRDLSEDEASSNLGDFLGDSEQTPSASGNAKFASRQWEVLGVATPAYLKAAESWEAWGFLSAGIVFTLLISGYLFRSLGLTVQAKRLAVERSVELDERTAELIRANFNLEREIGERLRAEADNIRLAAFPNEHPNPILECDEAGKIGYRNPTAIEVLKSLDLERIEDFLPHDHLAVVRICFEGHKERVDSEAHIGSRIFRWTYHYIAATGTLHLYVTDVTEHKHSAHEKARLETQLHQAQKMEAVGTLAGGIAHDFNNLLTGVLGYANMLKLEAEPGGRVYKAADVIEQAAERASQLTKQLLGFARKGKLQNTAVDLHATIHEAVSLLSRTIDKNITLSRKLRAENPTTLGDPGQMQQVIMNLAINARDAMPEGGELTFESEIVELDAEDCRRFDEADPGRYLMISVADTGCGIPRVLQDRVFEPFFTTKEQGRGSGMGLAMVYGIVKNHGGLIRLYSEEGRGTTFRIYLPAAAESKSVSAGSADGAPIRGSGRILIIDDEQVVRDMATDMLHALGYQVATAENGREGVELYRQSPDDFDLAVIDMIMPELGGRDCFRELKKINPDVRAILSTGYSRDGAAQEILDEGMLGFAQKPYRLRQFSEIVAAALAAERDSNSSAGV